MTTSAALMKYPKQQKRTKEERPAFRIDEEVIEAAKRAAEIFEQEEREYAEQNLK